jgi:phosphate transport system permease protein
VTPPSETATAAEPDEATASVADSLRQTAKGTRGDRVFRGVALTAGLVVLVVLAMIAVSTTREAWPAFTEQGISFITTNDWAPSRDSFGALAFIFGTVLSSFIALLLAVPVSVGIALFTLEVAPPKLRMPVAYVIDLLAAIPSVVFGLWGIAVFAPFAQPIYQSISDAVGDIPVLSWVFGGQAFGKSVMTASIILSIMITPIITSLSREVLATVPCSQKEAAIGLGATRWEMIRQSMIPWSRGGIVGAVMLGLGRAMGETIAVALVIGASAQITTQVFSPGDSMAAVIANQFGEAGGLHRSALMGLGVVLFGITIVVNMSARSVVGRFELKHGGRGL